MNRRQLFLSTAKAALATAFGGIFPFRGAKAQEMTGTPEAPNRTRCGCGPIPLPSTRPA